METKALRWRPRRVAYEFISKQQQEVAVKETGWFYLLMNSYATHCGRQRNTLSINTIKFFYLPKTKSLFSDFVAQNSRNLRLLHRSRVRVAWCGSPGVCSRKQAGVPRSSSCSTRARRARTALVSPVCRWRSNEEEGGSCVRSRNASDK